MIFLDIKEQFSLQYLEYSGHKVLSERTLLHGMSLEVILDQITFEIRDEISEAYFRPVCFAKDIPVIS